MGDIKKLLRDRREQLGLTMKEVAEACGVSEGAVSRWESGDIANMRRSRIVLLAKVLKISPLQILEIENGENEGDVFTASPEERILLEAFRSAPPEIRAAVLRVLGAE